MATCASELDAQVELNDAAEAALRSDLPEVTAGRIGAGTAKVGVVGRVQVVDLEPDLHGLRDAEVALYVDVPVADAIGAHAVDRPRKHTQLVGAGHVGGAAFEPGEPGRNRARAFVGDARIEPGMDVRRVHPVMGKRVGDLAQVAVVERVVPLEGRSGVPLIDPAGRPSAGDGLQDTLAGPLLAAAE